MNRRHLLAGAAALPLAAIRPREGRAQSGISDGVVKIGVLDDMSGVFADQQGMGDVVSARMAVEDFGGRVNLSFNRSSQHHPERTAGPRRAPRQASSIQASCAVCC